MEKGKYWCDAFCGSKENQNPVLRRVFSFHFVSTRSSSRASKAMAVFTEFYRVSPIDSPTFSDEDGPSQATPHPPTNQNKQKAKQNKRKTPTYRGRTARVPTAKRCSTRCSARRSARCPTRRRRRRPRPKEGQRHTSPGRTSALSFAVCVCVRVCVSV